jgi:hypothetical protein
MRCVPVGATTRPSVRSPQIVLTTELFDQHNPRHPSTQRGQVRQRTRVRAAGASHSRQRRRTDSTRQLVARLQMSVRRGLDPGAAEARALGSAPSLQRATDQTRHRPPARTHSCRYGRPVVLMRRTFGARVVCSLSCPRGSCDVGGASYPDWSVQPGWSSPTPRCVARRIGRTAHSNSAARVPELAVHTCGDLLCR